MHASTVKQALTRLFEFFPPEQIEQARRQIAGALRGFVCQKLIPAIEGGGRFAAHEILIADAMVSNLILDGENEKIQQTLETNSDIGSKAFNKDIYRLIKEGKISKADGLRFSPNPQALEMNLKGIFFKS
jgi:twitching motility protein PilT